MTFLGLFKKEVDLTDIVPEAHSFLGEIRNGKSELQAAKAAGASEEQVRLWKRHPAFREALRKAKTEGPPVGFIDLAHYDEPEDPNAIPWHNSSQDEGSIFGPMYGPGSGGYR